MTQVCSPPVSPMNTASLHLHLVSIMSILHPMNIKLSNQPSLTVFWSGFHLGLGKREMFELSKNAIEFIFADSGVKEDLRKIFASAAKNLDLS